MDNSEKNTEINEPSEDTIEKTCIDSTTKQKEEASTSKETDLKENETYIYIEVEGIGNDNLENEETPSGPSPVNDIAEETNASQGSSHEIYITNLDEDNDDTRMSSVSDTLKRGNEDLTIEFPAKKPKPELFTVDRGPLWYSIANDLVTPSIITKNLSKVFESLPIFGKPKTRGDLEKFYDEEIRNFIGCDLEEDEFKELGKYCSVEHLKTGKELNLKWDSPSLSILSSNEIPEINIHTTKLCTTKKYKMRNKVNLNPYLMRLKYRGLRMLPLVQVAAEEDPTLPCELNPGKDILFRARVYRPFLDNLQRDRNTRSRCTVFSCDVMVLGRQTLSELRDRITCNNDYDMRVDVSNTPDVTPTTTAKDVFPSGFLFINNTFYVDTRKGCVDNSAVIRAWAKQKGMGDFPKKDMCTVKLEDIEIKLGHPDVYVHQGSCEHVFTFSELRCVTSRDPLRAAHYPAHTAVTHNQTIYCTTCAEFGAKWVVAGCARVPFDPAFFCDTCFRQYLYKDGKKIGNFKAYAYRGNELNPLKPFG